jgi:hypothetical protein
MNNATGPPESPRMFNACPISSFEGRQTAYPHGCFHETCGDLSCQTPAACHGLGCCCCDGDRRRALCLDCPRPSVRWRLPNARRCPLPVQQAERQHLRDCSPPPVPHSSSGLACCCISHGHPSAADSRRPALLTAGWEDGCCCSPGGRPAHPRSAYRMRTAASRHSWIGHCSHHPTGCQDTERARGWCFAVHSRLAQAPLVGYPPTVGPQLPGQRQWPVPITAAS